MELGSYFLFLQEQIKDIIIIIAGIPDANSGVAIGGAKEEKSTTTAAKRHGLRVALGSTQ